MKKILLMLMLGCLALNADARNAVFDKLSEVNVCWLEQADAHVEMLQPKPAMAERDWIRFHLQLVEQTLRNRSTQGLTNAQIQHRMKSLDDLNAYWHAEKFPVNDRYAERTPIFIDAADNFCAVGYLLKASGNEAISRKISATTNLAYVRQMDYPELTAWASTHGFTVDELAWIQPGYPPMYGTGPLGKGTNGTVRAFHADESAGVLYVGGDFTMVDSTIPASHIAMLSEQNDIFSWQAIGTGGPAGAVHAIRPFDGKLFTAGTDGAHYWDGTTWQAAGQTTGTLYALQELNGTLYAAGNFSDPGGNTGNFASWTAGEWQMIDGLSGTVYTMDTIGNSIVLGGSLSAAGVSQNAMRWSVTGGFEPFDNALVNEVRDFEIFGDTLYAACRRTSTDSSKLLMRLLGNRWEQHRSGNALNGFDSTRSGLSINALCANEDRLLAGGAFSYLPGIGTYGSNSLSFLHFQGNLYPDGGGWIVLDSDVHAIVRFKEHVIYGGSFRAEGLNGSAIPPANRGLNNITARMRTRTSVSGTNTPATFSIAPNPVQSRGHLQLTTNNRASSYQVLDIAGRTVLSGKIAGSQKNGIALPALAGGTYILELGHIDGTKSSQKFSVQ